MTDAKSSKREVKSTNSSGGFYRFSYDIFSVPKLREIKLAWSFRFKNIQANLSINKAEREAAFLGIFGGIFRQCFLEVLPKQLISLGSQLNSKSGWSLTSLLTLNQSLKNPKYN